ncbi:MAG: hypothetical protein O7B24_02065 [Alphaproteobacteria bacterium]|nr:hypothetical protein [Alphaproteobacteria bacterium]
MTQTPRNEKTDWVSRRGAAVVAWGLPIVALVAATGLDHPAKTLVWLVALTWMGLACLANARRCGRMHCRFTGPFFLLMAALATLHGFEVVWLGTNGWQILGLIVLVGGILLTVVPEKLWGKYTAKHRSQA